MEQKKTNKMGSRMNANLPAMILVAVLLFTWQAAAMGIIPITQSHEYGT